MGSPNLPPLITRTSAQRASWVIPKNAIVRESDTGRLWTGDGATVGGQSPFGLSLASQVSNAPLVQIATGPNPLTNGARNDITTANPGRVTRMSHVSPGACSQIRLAYANLSGSSVTSGESPAKNPIIVAAAIEYPLGTVYIVTFNGSRVGRVDVNGTLLSDPIAVSIPAGAMWWERCYATSSLPPNPLTATAGTGGSLAAGTYYYVITSVTDLGESSASTEVSATVSASGKVTLAWTDANKMIPTRYFRVYRGTSTGSEVLLEHISPWSTNYVDSGSITPGVATPPTPLSLPVALRTSQVIPHEQSIFFGTQALCYDPAGGGFATSANVIYSAYAIYGVLAPGSPPPIAVLGDSIASGTGDASDLPLGQISRNGFICRALNNGFPYLNVAQGGESAAVFVANCQRRLAACAGCTYAVSNYGTNDLSLFSVATIKSNILSIARQCQALGMKVFWCTLNPKTTSTDNWATAQNQAPLTTPDGVDPTYPSIELRRVAINTWIRDTSADGFVAQAGGPGLAGFFDTAAPVEVDASNVITLNGGRYLSDGTALDYTIDGTHPAPLGHAAMATGIDTTQFIPG